MARGEQIPIQNIVLHWNNRYLSFPNSLKTPTLRFEWELSKPQIAAQLYNYLQIISWILWGGRGGVSLASSSTRLCPVLPARFCFRTCMVCSVLYQWPTCHFRSNTLSVNCSSIHHSHLKERTTASWSPPIFRQHWIYFQKFVWRAQLYKYNCKVASHLCRASLSTLSKEAIPKSLNYI